MRWSVMPRRLQAGGTSHGRTSRAGRQAGVRFPRGGGGGCRASGRPGQGTVDPFPCPVYLPVVGCPVGHGSVEQFLLSVVVSGLVGFVPDGVAHRDCGLVLSLDWFGSVEPFDSSVLVDFGEFALGAVRPCRAMRCPPRPDLSRSFG